MKKAQYLSDKFMNLLPFTLLSYKCSDRYVKFDLLLFINQISFAVSCVVSKRQAL